MDDEGHPTIGPGEFDEFAVATHPRLERSAPLPVHDFDWPGLYARMGEAEAKPDLRMEIMADALGALLRWLVEPRTSRRVGLRALMLAWTLGRKDLLSSKQRKALRNHRWAEKRKARAAKAT